MRERRDDVDREAPPAVVAAVAIGTAPLPIVGVYTVLFLVHGSLRRLVTEGVGEPYASGRLAG